MNTDNALLDVLALLSAAVIAIPLFHKLKLGSVLGYLTAGCVLGPWGLEIIIKVTEIRPLAEFGVVFLLFLIGIEMKPARLWVMRHWVFGLGLAQLLLTGSILAGIIALMFDLTIKTAVISGFGLALSSTAFGLQVLSEKGELASITGRSAFSVLLLQDIAIVPLLAVVSFITDNVSLQTDVESKIIVALATIIFVVISGRYLLNPIFERIAASRNSEVFIAAALLLVLGVAKLMESVGLSMALGAFLAGLMLAESHFRHQIEADIQPFRGILLGLFFMSVGMSIDFGLLRHNFGLVLSLCMILMLVKTLILWLLCRLSGINYANALRVSILLSQAGEFGFVLFAYAMLSGIIQETLFQLWTLVIALSMVTTPFAIKLGDWWIKRKHRTPNEAPIIHEVPGENRDHVILAGFGRVGQRIGTLLQAAQIPYISLDFNHQQVTEGRNKGFPVYFGDARQLNVLKAAGADRARMLVVSLDNVEHTGHLVNLVRQHYPHLPIHVRAKDRAHCENLLINGADNVISETLEASLRLSEIILSNSGVNQTRTAIMLEKYRRSYYRQMKKQLKKA